MITVDGDDYGEVAKQVRRFEPALAKAMRANITRAGKPVLADVRSAALGLPSGKGAAKTFRKKRGDTSSAGLRQGIARATEIKTNTRPGQFSLRVRVSGTKFTAATGKPRTLPRRMEGTPTAWRHPVFGRDPWVVQRSHPFLIPTASRHKAAVERAVKTALQSAVDDVVRGLRT